MSLRILAFNTVTDLCSVAILIDQKIYSYNILAPQLHAEQILPMIDRLLVDSGVLLKSFDCIVFDQGPGSFIGLRIGINVAQGLSLGTDIPLIGVSSLEVLAQGAWRIFSVKYVIATINAKMNELYWAFYQYDINNHWICKNNISLSTAEILQKKICMLNGEWFIVGTGWDSHKSLKLYIENSNIVIKKKIMYPDAQDMLLLGVSFYKEKKFLQPDQVTPIYPNLNFIK